MRKYEKLMIVDELTNRTSKLNYSSNDQPQISVIIDTLSFIRNNLDKSNATEWLNRINNIYWGVSKANNNEAETTRFNRWHDGRNFLIEILKSIKREIELYTVNELDNTSDINSKIDIKPVIFLSHCSEDKQYSDALEIFITGLGVKKEQLIYTSHPLHKIPLDVNIYDYLRKSINRNLYMVFLWSNIYLEKPACLNEMGAAWVFHSDYTNIFTPDFDFENQKFNECVIDTRKMGIILGDKHCRNSMIEFKDKILSLFGLSVDEKQSSYLLDEFMEKIMEIINNQNKS